MGSILVPSGVITNDSYSCTYCRYVRCVILIVRIEVIPVIKTVNIHHLASWNFLTIVGWLKIVGKISGPGVFFKTQIISINKLQVKLSYLFKYFFQKKIV